MKNEHGSLNGFNVDGISIKNGDMDKNICLKSIFHINCIIKKMFYKLYYMKHISFSKGVTWRKWFSLWIENGYVSIGRDVFFNNGCSISCINEVLIGDNCLFGENVKIYDHNHRFQNRNISVKKQGFSIGRIIIGDNCWIGSNVVILKGANIGNHVVIGAGCVVNGIIPSNMIVKMRANNLILEPLRETEGI